jgi:hypothetical protein
MINKRAQRVNREDRNVRQLLYTPSLRFTKTLDPACSDVSTDFSRFHGDVFLLCRLRWKATKFRSRCSRMEGPLRCQTARTEPPLELALDSSIVMRQRTRAPIEDTCFSSGQIGLTPRRCWLSPVGGESSCPAAEQQHASSREDVPETRRAMLAKLLLGTRPCHSIAFCSAFGSSTRSCLACASLAGRRSASGSLTPGSARAFSRRSLARHS